MFRRTRRPSLRVFVKNMQLSRKSPQREAGVGDVVVPMTREGSRLGHRYTPLNGATYRHPLVWLHAFFKFVHSVRLSAYPNYKCICNVHRCLCCKNRIPPIVNIRRVLHNCRVVLVLLCRLLSSDDDRRLQILFSEHFNLRLYPTAKFNSVNIEM